MPRKPVAQTHIPGFGFIYQPTYRSKKTGELKRSAVWWSVEYRTGAKNIPRSTKRTDQAEAFGELMKLAGRRASGEIREIAPERVRVNTLLDLLLDDYIDEGKKTLYDVSCRVKRHLRPGFGDMRAVEVTTAVLKDWAKLARAGRNPISEESLKISPAKPLSDASVNRCLANLHRAFQIGFDHDPPLVIRIPKFPFKTEDNARQGTVNELQYRMLRDNLASHAQVALVIGYHVGMRKGELLSLRWDQVAFDEKVIYLERKQTKNKTPRTAPIYGDMRPYLEMAQAERDANYPDCPYVVQIDGKRIYSIKTTWLASIERLKLPKLLVHDLRRTAATAMSDAGIPESEIMSVLGWKSSAMLRRYRIGSAKKTAAIGTKMDAVIELRKLEQASGKEPIN